MNHKGHEGHKEEWVRISANFFVLFVLFVTVGTAAFLAVRFPAVGATCIDPITALRAE